MNRHLPFATALAVASLLLSSVVAAQGAPDDRQRASEPIRADAPVSRTAPVPGLSSSYSVLPSLEPLVWQRIFDERGDFVAPGGAQFAEPTGAPRLAQAASQPPPASPSSAADGTATVLRIDREAGRVRLRHGPIAKLEMPAMTMLFQVADPALLDQVKEGETVGIRVEQRGQAYVITGWVREAAK
jgi:Cu/Ag efflux protein CusF